MSLLSIADDVLAEAGLIMPSKLIGNADVTARRVLACAKAEAEHLYRAHNWTILAREYEFETEAGEEAYELPADFGRISQKTAWDRAQYWAIRGSVTASQWQRNRGALVSRIAGAREFRLLAGPLAGAILIDPVPTATGQELVYEYTSSYWCESAAGEGQPEWRADTDEFRLDHEVFKLGLLWRVKRANGHPYEDERADAEMELSRAKLADSALEPFQLAPTTAPLWPNVPEGNWGV